MNVRELSIDEFYNEIESCNETSTEKLDLGSVAIHTTSEGMSLVETACGKYAQINI
jgi:hypothetical protein